MDLHCPHLDLSPCWAGEDDGRRIVIVRAIDAIRLCGARGAYERASETETLWGLRDCRMDLGWQIRRFALDIRLLSPYGSQTGDDDVFVQITAAIERRELVGLRRNRAVVAVETEPTRIERQLIRNIESQTRGWLSEAGRKYKLVAGADLPGMPDRDSYEVVRHDDARRVLDAIAKQSTGQADLVAQMGQARDTLSPDWRPPLGPKGLVLVRKIVAPRAAVSTNEEASTPSQIREMMEKAALEIHVVDLNQKPQDGLAFRIAMPDGGTVAGKLDKDGRGRAKSSTPGVFSVTFPDLDGADWDGDGALDLPTEEGRIEASRYKVEQGDRLPTIARKMGFARWETIWDFAGNGVLKELRGNAHVLFPGDAVSIPSKLARVAEVQGGTAEYVVPRDPDWWLRLQLHADDYRHCPDTPYVLTLPSGVEVKGKTDGKGWLDCTLFAEAATCKITYWPDGTDKPGVVTEVFLKEDQGDSDEDFMNHLRNLGFGNADDSLATMASRYQQYMDISPTGQLDEETKASIRKAIDKADDSLHQELGDDE
jgi:hypothetical protein